MKKPSAATDVHALTAQTYAALGKTYLDAVRDHTPKKLLDFLALLPKGAEVLDVGTAGGRDAKLFAKAGMKVTGIDIIDTFLEQARKAIPQGSFLKMDMRTLDFPEATFDGIYVNASLLHLEKEEVPTVLMQMHRVLKPNGKLWVRVKLGTGSAIVKEKLSGGLGRFYSFYSEAELKALLSQSGFTIRAIYITEDTHGRSDVRWISIIADR